MLEAFGTFKRSEKGHSGLIFIPADIVTDSAFPFRSSDSNLPVKVMIDQNQLLIRLESPVKLSIYDPKNMRTRQDFRNLTELYEFLRPYFKNKMWKSFLPHLFLAIGKDGQFAGATMHWNVEASNSLHHYFKAIRAAEETGFTRRIGLSDYEVVKDLEAMGRFARRFDELAE